MSWTLTLALLGLAVVDSINLSTIWVVVIILLAAKRPAATGWGFAIGALISFFTFTLLAYFGADLAGDVISDLTLWLRRVIFASFAILLLVFGIRRLKTRERKGFGLPKWVNAWSAFPLGLIATIGDIPNAFPMFFAVERLIDAGVENQSAVVALAGYALVYIAPTVALLIAGLLFGTRLRQRLQKLYDRFATGPALASIRRAILFFAAAAALLAVLIVVIR